MEGSVTETLHVLPTAPKTSVLSLRTESLVALCMSHTNLIPVHENKRREISALNRRHTNNKGYNNRDLNRLR